MGSFLWICDELMWDCEIKHHAEQDHILSYFIASTSGSGLSWLLEHLEGQFVCPVGTARLFPSVSCDGVSCCHGIVLSRLAKYLKYIYSWLADVVENETFLQCAIVLA